MNEIPIYVSKEELEAAMQLLNEEIQNRKSLITPVENIESLREKLRVALLASGTPNIL